MTWRNFIIGMLCLLMSFYLAYITFHFGEIQAANINATWEYNEGIGYYIIMQPSISYTLSFLPALVCFLVGCYILKED